MKHISELANILNNYLNWNKARVTCLAQILRSIIVVKTVNLSQIATCFYSKSKIDSSYKRIQRFLRFFDFDLSVIVKIVMVLFPMPRKIVLIIDRTNWTWGKSHLNLLVLSIAYHGISIPIFWYNLARAGNSKTQDRINIVSKILNYIGKNKIKYLLADREFVGNVWFDWLITTGINFIIRIKHDTMTGREKNCKYKTPVSSLFKRLKKCKHKNLKKQYWLDKHEVFLAASRSPIGELLVLATPKFTRKAIEIYQIRWEIETLFGCLKSKGFCLEETRLIKEQRLEKLFFVLTLAFIWAYQAGMFRSIDTPIKTKKHGRKSHCLFRYGLEILRKAIINNLKFKFFLLLLIDTKTLKLRSYQCV
jgi:hypothetical protein